MLEYEVVCRVEFTRRLGTVPQTDLRLQLGDLVDDLLKTFAGLHDFCAAKEGRGGHL